jgi:hypothetical protein
MTNIKEKLDDLQKKARERTVKTQTIEFDLETLAKKIVKKVIKLDPDYQRRHRWDLATSSRLIESLILNIPIPFIYLSQDFDADTEIDNEEGLSRYTVIDGQQRLTSIVEFLSNKFSLTELGVLQDLEGMFYKDLPPFLIRRLEERTIKCLRIDSTVDSQVKYDIFERLNTGSVKLEPQELRNAVSRGPFNDLIKELAKNKYFRIHNQIRLTDPEHSKKVQKMEDVELVLRFFSLADENYKSLKKGFKTFLTDEMNKFNEKDSGTLTSMKMRFEKLMELIHDEFGIKAFAKYKYENGELKMMSSFNAAVYDALTVSLASKIDINTPILKPSAAESFKSLFKDIRFFNAVSGSVNDKEKVVARIDLAKMVF